MLPIQHKDIWKLYQKQSKAYKPPMLWMLWMILLETLTNWVQFHPPPKASRALYFYNLKQGL